MTDDVERLLLDAGIMAPECRDTFRAVPRAAFLPDVIWPFAGTGPCLAVDRRTAPREWQRWAEENVPVTVQWDDGAAAGPGELCTSSASMPGIVAQMLRDLHVRPGMRVLEIGTGTGWNAALLCRHLGDGAVTTVEVDPVLADRARARLDAAGYRPAVVTGDGLAGHEAGAPFDRIIATAGLRRIPAAWIAQTRTAGVIVAPWGTHYSSQDAIVRLVVSEDGSACGRFTGPAEFMKVRSQRLNWPEHDDYVQDWPGAVAHTDLALEEVMDGSYGGTGLILGLLVGAVTHTVHEGAAWLYGLDDRSWAVAAPDGGRLRVHQLGPRRLWDEVEAAYRWWQDQGRPGITEFGLTVDRDGRHRVWLADPSGPSWPV